jgi:hypothetical protein
MKPSPDCTPVKILPDSQCADVSRETFLLIALTPENVSRETLMQTCSIYSVIEAVMGGECFT